MFRKYAVAVFSFIFLTVVLWVERDMLTLGNFTTIYILVVLVIAIRFGTIAAMSAAILSFMSINFFFTSPRYTFFITDTRDVIDLVVFVIVAALSGQLGARARYQANEAAQRAHEQEMLYRITGAINQAASADAVHRALTQSMYRDLQSSQSYILPGDNNDRPDISNVNTQSLPLSVGEKVYGTLCITLDYPVTDRQIRLLHTCAAQAATALQRIELAEQARVSQQYEEADRLKTAILRAVSHDLRTPITIIKTSASNLRTLGETLPVTERQDIAEAIENEADHLNDLVGNLLDLSRLQAGALTLNCELNSLEEVAGDVAARVWQTTGRERVKICFPEDMLLCSFDYGLVLQALTNLVDNALRYEPPESQIEICGCVEDNNVRIRVINHGKTIIPADHIRIMEPFFHREDGHIGLGLPIAKGIIESHQGELWVEDTPGGGATFVLSLPVDNQEDMGNEITSLSR